MDRDSGFIGSEGSRQSRISAKQQQQQRRNAASSGNDRFTPHDVIAEADDAETRRMIAKYGRDREFFESTDDLAAIGRQEGERGNAPNAETTTKWTENLAAVVEAESSVRDEIDIRDGSSCGGSSGHNSSECGHIHNNAEILKSLQRELRQLKEAFLQQREILSGSTASVHSPGIRDPSLVGRWESPGPTPSSPRPSSSARRRRAKSSQNLREIGSEAETSAFSSSETSISARLDGRGQRRGDAGSRGSRTPSRGRESANGSNGSGRAPRHSKPAPKAVFTAKSIKSPPERQQRPNPRGGRRGIGKGNWSNAARPRQNPNVTSPYQGNVESTRYPPEWAEAEAYPDNFHFYHPPPTHSNHYSSPPTPYQVCTCPSCSIPEYDYSYHHAHNNPHLPMNQGLPPSHFHPIHQQQQQQYSMDDDRNRNNFSYQRGPPIVEPTPVVPMAGYFSPTASHGGGMPGILSPLPPDPANASFQYISTAPPPTMMMNQIPPASMYDKLPPPSLGPRDGPVGAPPSVVTINTVTPVAASTPVNK